VTRILLYADTHNFHPELTQERQDGFVSYCLTYFLTDTYEIVSIMQRVRFSTHEILNLGLRSICLMALTKSHKYVYASVQLVYVLTFVALGDLLSLFTCKTGDIAF